MNSGFRAFAVAALLVAAPMATACNTQPDVEEQVSRSLEQNKLDNVRVEWDDEAKIAHLRGSVNSSADRQRAEEIANTAVGTNGTVLNELTVEGMNEEAADDMDGQIRDRLSEMVDNDATLKDRDIDFDVNNGVVTVKGEVRSAAEKQQVDQMVKAAPGVKDFENALEIRAEQ
jgi:osmotically-inducible protein OsmY